MPRIHIISGDAISATDHDGNATALGSADQGAGAHLGGLTLSPDATLTGIDITDEGGRADWLEDSTGGQTLTHDTVVNGILYPAGTPVEAEYQITLTGSDGQSYKAWALEVEDGTGENYDNVVGLIFHPAEVPPAGVTLRVTDNLDLYNLDDANTEEFRYADSAPCFTAGTLIDTEDGPCPVEALRPGMRVQTADSGLAEVLWVGLRHLSQADLAARPALLPYLVQGGALGNARPLMVSPQHRLCRADGTFAPARALAGTPGARVRLARGCRGVTYAHLLCARHHVIRSEGMWSETLFPGRQALLSMSPAQMQEILALFPGLRAVLHQPGPLARMRARQAYGPLARPEVRRPDRVA